jgi:hypothetical protein
LPISPTWISNPCDPDAGIYLKTPSIPEFKRRGQPPETREKRRKGERETRRIYLTISPTWIFQSMQPGWQNLPQNPSIPEFTHRNQPPETRDKRIKGEREKRRQGDKETRRQGDKVKR